MCRSPVDWAGGHPDIEMSSSASSAALQRLTLTTGTGIIRRVAESRDYGWLFDDLRSDPGDFLSRDQYQIVLTRLGGELNQLPEGIPEDALSNIEQYVLRLWFALNGDDSRIEGIRGQYGWIVDAYRIYVDLHNSDLRLTQEQRQAALLKLRKVLDDLVATAR